MSSILAKMAVQISANTAEFNKALAKTNKDISSFTTGVNKVAGFLGAAFGAQQIASFVLEVSKLAGEAEGVANAFNKLNNSKQLLLDLQKATKGTVSELTLMKRSVQFSNFGLELSKLPTLLEFATKRAQATGQSVDYLVDSIVTGLGRKSVLILDNLGISAIQLREEMAKVGDITVAVSNIIERDMASGGGIIETVALRTERLSASWENFKVSIGTAANDTGLLGMALEGLNESLIVLASNTLSAGEKIAFFAANPIQRAAILAQHYALEVAEANRQTQRTELVQKNAAEAFEKYNGNLEEFLKHITPGHKNTELLVEAFKKLQKQQSDQISLDGTLQGAMEEQAVLQKQKLTLRGAELAQTNIRLAQISEEIRLLNELGIAEKKTMPKTPSLEVKPIGGGLQSMTSGIDFDKMNQGIKEFLSTLKLIPPELKKVADETIELSGIIAGGIGEIAEAIGQTAIEGPKNFGRAFLHSLATFAQQFGGLLIATGLGEIALRSGNPALMIAGGTALIAAGAAIKALTKPTLSGGSGGGGQSFPSRPTVNEGFQNFALTTSVSGTDLNIVMGNTNNRNRFTRP